MNRKTIVLHGLLLAMALPLSAQVSLERQVVGSLGGYSTSATIQLSATVGEPAVTTLENATIILLQGFQQPEPEDLTGTEYVSELLEDLSVFPNPAQGQFWVSFATEESVHSVSLEAVDLTGRTILRRAQVPRISGPIPVSTRAWPAGIYLVRLRAPSGQLLGSTKVMVQ
ncbi:T9SS type A sorting domain-containing protein [Lewinella sp. W8]|uniref:T9SS type A sorting domain-containing protein n=1 Tax=Lewinella sp. W8 TaxID=2528208 RepID=UPI00156593A7|nr:T9SS type A sorting domain-containing protein [Lewinella sp. W8]